MTQLFDLSATRRQQVLVEYLTATGSAFAVTPQGEQVFLNKRLVETMEVLAGDIYRVVVGHKACGFGFDSQSDCRLHGGGR